MLHFYITAEFLILVTTILKIFVIPTIRLTIDIVIRTNSSMSKMLSRNLAVKPLTLILVITWGLQELKRNLSLP